MSQQRTVPAGGQRAPGSWRESLLADQALALYDPAEHRPLATRFGHDTAVTTLGHRSSALWLLGYPEAALRDADDALRNARELGQAATLMLALCITAVPYILCGNRAAAAAQAQELVALAEEKGSLFWKAYGMVSQGCVLALTGRASDATEMLISAMAAMRTTGATFWIPFSLLHLARAHAELGQFQEAWRCIGEAMTAAGTTKEKWGEAEIHRTAGEIALMSPEPDAAKRRRISSVPSPLPARRRQSPGSCAPRRAWLDCRAIRANANRPAIFSPRSMAGSPKASTRSTSRRPKLCSTRWLDDGACCRE